MKIEISKREIKDYEWELKLLTSPTSVIQVMGQVASLEQIYKDKLTCLKGRAKPKDFFDLWYISEKLKIPYTPREIASKKDFIRDLRKYLPKDFWPAVEGLIK